MKVLVLVAASALIAYAGSARADEAPQSQTAEPQYPTWLVMKPGYAEACINEGGCIPLSQADLKKIENIIRMQTIESFCPQTRTDVHGPKVRKLTSLGPTLANID